MPTPTFRSPHVDPWSSPRSYRDPSLRFAKHGKIRPMEDERLSPRRRVLVLIAALAVSWAVFAAASFLIALAVDWWA